MPAFNYIIPIFNKEDILPLTLAGIDRCASRDARIFTVIDGCTDGSERVVDDFAARTGRDVVKIHTPDVHMLLSVNAALRQVTGGYSIVMQDDIILEDPETEQKIVDLYARMGSRLGMISFRMGSNIRRASVLECTRMRSRQPMVEVIDGLQSLDDTQSYPTLPYNRFVPRMAAVNGPNVMPWTMVQQLGIFDETLAPYGYDDVEYCLRAIRAGFVNGVFPIKYRSDVEWGGTRRSKKFLRQVRAIHRRNRAAVWQTYAKDLKALWQSGQVYRLSAPVDTLDFFNPSPAPLPLRQAS
jgi:glycosyltransferase involved in cell wall biosynthesis